jgi:small-conductance mechanosensitive channel
VDELNVFEWMFYDNTLRVWLISLAVGLFTFFVLGLARTLVVRQFKRLSERTRGVWDDALVHAVSAIRSGLLLLIAVWAGSLVLALPPRLRGALEFAAIFALLVQVGISGTTGVRSYVGFYGERRLEQDAASVMTARAIGFLASIALWLIIFLVVLDNFGIDVTALVAGLGIGGIAIALALQKILGDLFASLSIVLDKPFVVGDFIIVDDLLGTVENVGLKTTRVRALSGEQLVFSNSDLLESRIRNFKRMYERRIVFSFGVEYQTPPDKLEWIPLAVREIIEALPDLRFDRAHFKGYGDSSLDFEVVYYVLLPDFNTYMDRQQAINLALYRAFEERAIAFAFPTRTVHLVGAEVAAGD